MQPPFPFSAIVGHEPLKRALLLGVIQPRLGGVLVRGTKGVAKSTAVRALAHLLPPIETVAGCPFQRRPGEAIAGWPLPADSAVITRPVPLVELPLGAGEDRVLGALHLEKALRGERACTPGLLAAANRGILYVDEVNLLPDHLVDVLLDAAAAGVHRLEREGLSLAHPARFLLVGTMNPEEGELRPQLLDRFGLVVDVTDLADPAERALAVRRRLAYEADPASFVGQWQAADRTEAERIVQAQRLLPTVTIGDDLLHQASRLCLAAGVEGLRADLVLCQAAAAWAAYQGRTVVEAADLDRVAELALAHRRTRPPEPPDGRSPPRREREQHPRRECERSEPEGSPQSASRGQGGQGTITEPIAGLYQAAIAPSPNLLRDSRVAGRWPAADEQRGPPRALPADRAPAFLDWSATVRAAALNQVERGWAGGLLRLRPEDLRYRRRQGPAGALLFFVIDSSGSMAAWRRMRQTKAAVLALLLQAYRRRDLVALLAFRGAAAELVLPPTRSLRRARAALEELPAGGTTPLAEGLRAARQFLIRRHRREPWRPIWTVILTDGRANVSVGRDPAGERGDFPEPMRPALFRRVAAKQSAGWIDALHEARLLATCAGEFLVIDTETGWPRFGQARKLAGALGADCLALEQALARPIRRREVVA